MHTLVNEKLLEEVRSFALCYTCETCAHFDASAERCGNGYPTFPHRAVALEKAQLIVFCKDFELC